MYIKYTNTYRHAHVKSFKYTESKLNYRIVLLLDLI